jgi:hypothetical protein
MASVLRRLARTILVVASLAGRVVASQAAPAMADSIVRAINQQALLRSFSG